MRAPGIYSSLDEIHAFRERMNAALDYLDERPLNVIEILPPLVEHTVASLPYQGLTLRALFEKQGRIFHDKIISKAYPHLCAPIESPRKPGRFRIGYISGALNLNNGNRWALGWLKNHGPEFETFALNLGPEDIGSRMWERDAEHYYNLQGNLQRIAEFIRGLDLDAIIATDVGYRNRDYFYFSMRLARVQCTAWGAPMTSGLPNIDYYLSSDFMEPPGAEQEYTEKLVRLPRSGLCYPRLKSKFWVGEFVRDNDEFFPFMAQNLLKWTPQRDRLLKRVADRHGKPLKMVALPDAEPTEMFSKRLTKAGIHHEFLPTTRQMGFANYLRSANVSFDPPDWSGGNTTIEALSYRIPVVALPGEFMRGRHSLAFLKIANVEGLIAKDEDDYIDLIFNEERRKEAMESLNVDALYEDKGVVEALDQFLLNASSATP
jgi:predicted O-linked N-acetylglucosamine transferase (SPINDLY family)